MSEHSASDKHGTPDGSQRTRTVNKSIHDVLNELLNMDLTYDNSDDSAVRQRGRAAEQKKKSELKNLSSDDRTWLLHRLMVKLSGRSSDALATICRILDVPVPSQPVSPPRPSMTPSAITGSTTVSSRVLRRLLQHVRNRVVGSRRKLGPHPHASRRSRAVRLPSLRATRPGPEHTHSLRSMLANPVLHRNPLLNNLYYAGSVPAELSLSAGKDGRLEHVWSSVHALYRTQRPETLGNRELLRTEVRVVPLPQKRWRVETLQSVPLYAEDQGWQHCEFTSLEESIKYAEGFIAKRFRIVREEVLALLTDLRNDTSLGTPQAAHAAVLELTAKLLGEEYRSPCAPLIGRWDSTLRSFLDEASKQEPSAVETYFALLPGWTLGKRELKSTVKSLFNSDNPTEESKDS